MATQTQANEEPMRAFAASWLLGIIVPLAALFLFLKPSVSPKVTWQRTLYLGPLGCLSLLWAYVASRYVPEPYLDEVFHIPQAQRYAHVKFYEWDDKLTTPPGLYVWSLVLFAASSTRAKSVRLVTAYDLRTTNAVSLIILSFLAMFCRHELDQLLAAKRTRSTGPQNLTRYSLHTALNIGLFPLLFFFSGLYYTDIASTLFVLAAFLVHLRRTGSVSRGQTPSYFNDVGTLLIGVLTLFMRQTNVFWTVVFMGGLEAVQAVKMLNPKPAKGLPSNSTLFEQAKYFVWRSSLGDVHDEQLCYAWVEDWALTAASLLIAAASNPFCVFRRIWPYIGVLVSFVGFVLWNGSVVLGDKTNHVATIHLAQMLYIWPFFAFFSLPLLLPYLVTVLDNLWAVLRLSGTTISKRQQKTSASHAVPAVSRLSITLGILYLLGTVALSLAIVRFNTIIHPFTLADNRHYMFYIFRYTIRRASWIRYALVAGYTVSRWLIWGLLSGNTDVRTALTNNKATRSDARETANDVSAQPVVPTSTAIIFILSTSLSLITAPLVEPRYFIIPWVIWRLLIPAWYTPSPRDGTEGGLIQAATGQGSFLGRVLQFARDYDIRLMLETLWFVFVNIATITIFLFKPYLWKAEDGTVLDGGRLQRFMW